MTDEPIIHITGDPPHLSRRGLILLVGITTMIGVSGFFMGLRQSSDFAEKTQAASAIRAAVPHIHQESEALDGEIPTAPRYSDLPATLTNPNRHWQQSLASLPREKKENNPQPVYAVSQNERNKILRSRASRRAYDGAPPTVPHPIDQVASVSCLSCHGLEATVVIDDRRPPVMSHAFMVNCIQCHVPTGSPLESMTDDWIGPQLGESIFTGRDSNGPGSRAFPGAPPTMPHSSAMRENCMSCHGPDRPNALRTTHAERVSCSQCHAPSAELDRRNVNLDGVQQPLPGLVPAPKQTPYPPERAKPSQVAKKQPPVTPSAKLPEPAPVEPNE